MTSRAPSASAVVVRTGVANLASVMAALERQGIAPTASTDPDQIAAASLVVLPGVGTFGEAMSSLRAAGLADAIAHRVSAGMPLLAICLGLQVLCAESEESPGVKGLGIVPARVTRLREGPGVRVPHLGWNTITPTPTFALATRGAAHFAHSYAVEALPPELEAEGWTVCTCDHGGLFVAALRRGPLLACQFHPELSGAWGAALIRSWADISNPQEARPCSAGV